MFAWLLLNKGLSVFRLGFRPDLYPFLIFSSALLQNPQPDLTYQLVGGDWRGELTGSGEVSVEPFHNHKNVKK